MVTGRSSSNALHVKQRSNQILDLVETNAGTLNLSVILEVRFVPAFLSLF